MIDESRAVNFVDSDDEISTYDSAEFLNLHSLLLTYDSNLLCPA